jgi:hypothetical protein
MDLYKKQFSKFMFQIGKSIEILFMKMGFGHLPHAVMYGIAGSVFMIPILLMCYVICCMKDDIEPEERPKQAQKPASSSKREKLE